MWVFSSFIYLTHNVSLHLWYGLNSDVRRIAHTVVMHCSQSEIEPQEFSVRKSSQCPAVRHISWEDWFSLSLPTSVKYQWVVRCLKQWNMIHIPTLLCCRMHAACVKENTILKSQLWTSACSPWVPSRMVSFYVRIFLKRGNYDYKPIVKLHHLSELIRETCAEN